MRDRQLDTTPTDRLLDAVWRLLAHEELYRLPSHRKPTTKGLDGWLRRSADRHRVAHDDRARRIVEAQPGLVEARSDLAARAIADRLRDDAVTPPPEPQTELDHHLRIAHLRAAREQLTKGTP